MTSYSVRNALVRRNKEAIDEDKRQAYPYRQANKEVFALEKKGAMEEIPKGVLSIEVLQTSSLLASQVFSLLQDLASNLSSGVLYNPEYFETRLATGIFAKAREQLLNYLNELKFKVIPEINRTKDRNLVNQTLQDLDKIYNLFNTITNDRLPDALLSVRASIDDRVFRLNQGLERKLRGLEETLINEQLIMDKLEKEISMYKQILLQQLTTSGSIDKYDVNETRQIQNQLDREAQEFYGDEQLFQEDQDLEFVFEGDDDEKQGAGYDPISQQKSQFEAGEKRFRDEMKQDEDDLEGMGLRFRLAKTKNKKR